jgi:hypothetical protein
VRDDQLLDEMRLRLQDGRVLGGAAAVAEIARRIWWAWPLWAFTQLPGAMAPMRSAYRWISRHRSCTNGACEIDSHRRAWLVALLPLFVLPIAALLIASWIPPWAFMWAMAVALYAGCKWLTYREARICGVPSNRLRAAGYLFAWPGMNATAFMSSVNSVTRPRRSEWISAGSKTLLGACLIWVVAPATLPGRPFLAAWLGMVGLTFVLHFGTFHLLSVAWRRIGVNAAPIMQNPLRSRSLAEFWGRRWNTAFHELATRFTFRPLRAIFGSPVATLIVFLVSGLIHELVISLPARGGYGLPTAYFVIQGLGVAGERTQFARGIGLARGRRGSLFTAVVAGAPVFWLFPQPFIRNVILPMLTFIGVN